MKYTKRNQPRRVAQSSRPASRSRDSLEAKFLKVCADIGWICGWREERLEQLLVARRSSRKRVMLGRALAAEAREQGDEAFRPVEVAFVSGGRAAHVHAEPEAEVSGLADFVLDAQDELARLARMGISPKQVAGALGDAKVRSLGRQLWERRR